MSFLWHLEKLIHCIDYPKFVFTDVLSVFTTLHYIALVLLLYSLIMNGFWNFTIASGY